MMTQAFYTGISGIKNNAFGIDVVTNNIANVSTVGFRGYETEFSSIFEETISTGTGFSNSVGAGVQVQSTSMIQEQGTLAISDRSTDLAIVGDGWFGLDDGKDGTLFTRDGAFSFDANRDLVALDGLHVLGTKAGNISADNSLTSKIENLQLGNVSTQEKLNFPETLSYPAQATTYAKFIGNVGTGYEPIAMSSSIVDAEGTINHLRLEFIKNETQIVPGSQYTVTATASSTDGETIYDTQSGAVEFDALGALTLSTLTTVDNNGSPIAINLGEGYDGVIAQDAQELSSSSMADGQVAGDLVGYSINNNADIIATFSNGEYSSIGKVAVFHFQNEQGLGRVSGTRFEETSNSGLAKFYTDANGNNINGSDTINYRLEGSNIELSYGLTELIILQRSYDANSKSITTADQMMQKALDMDA